MTKAISVRRARKARRCDGGCGGKLITVGTLYSRAVFFDRYFTKGPITFTLCTECLPIEVPKDGMGRKVYLALCISIHLWQFLAETGEIKQDWPWYDALSLDKMFAQCALCDIFRECSCCTASDGTPCPLRPVDVPDSNSYNAQVLCAGGVYDAWITAICKGAGTAQRYATRILRKLERALKALPLLTVEQCIEEVRRGKSIH